MYPDKWVVVEHPSSSPLPGGLIVRTYAVTLGENKFGNLPVLISNPTTHNITIHQRCIVAELKAVRSVTSSQSYSMDETEPFPDTSLEVNFGNSPIPSEWK